ncbi:MAG: hypothetical protein ACYC63_17775 [Armatimonadota bacterium]
MRHALLILLALITAPVLAADPTLVPLPNPSFEEGTLEDLQGWAVGLNDGAQSKLSLVTQPVHSGQRSLLIEKTNGRGFLLLQSTQPIPIQPKVEYESQLFLRVIQRQYGGKVYFVNEERDAEGKVIAVRYSPHHTWLPGYQPQGQWKRMWARWTATDNAASVVLRFVILGNPATLAIDDISLTANPEIQKHPAKVNNSEPPYDEQKALATLGRRKAEPASVKTFNGQPQFVVGGRPYAPLIHNGSFWNPDASRFANFGKAGIHLQTLAIQLGPQPGSKNLVWDYPKDLDLSYLDRLLKKIASADPQAQVIVLVRCNLPRQWSLDHPEENFMTEDGQHVVSDGHPKRLGTPETPQEYWPQSYGSPLFIDATMQALRQIGEWVKTHESGKLVVGWMIAGGNDGQFFNNGFPMQRLDHSPGQLRGFRQWLRSEYGTIEKLRAAWGDPQVTFGTATICTEAERESKGSMFHALKGPGRRVVDCVKFDNIAPARAVRLFARALKKSVGRPTFAMTYYPDAVYDQGSNKFALTELLMGNDIDAATAVQEYAPSRAPGGTGGTNASWGVYRLRNKIHIAEIDYRTYLSSMVGPIYDVEGLGATLTAEGFRSQVMRDIAASCARGMGTWFYDMGGIWYDDPPLWEVITDARKAMEWSHRPEAPAPDAQMAVYVDETVGTVIGKQHYGLLHSSTNQARLPLALSGVPYDIYFLQDLTNPKLRDYKLHVVLSGYTITKEQLGALKRRGLAPGKTLMVCGLLGGASEDYPTFRPAMEALTGLKGWEDLPSGHSFNSVRCENFEHPFLRNVPEVLSYGGAAAMEWPTLRHPDVTTLATLGTTTAPGLSLWRDSGRTFVFTPVPGGFTPELINNIAQAAGIKNLGTPNQATYVGCGVAAVHHIVPGEATLRFGTKVDLLDPATGMVLDRGVTQWPAEGELLSTSLRYYRPSK